MPFLVKDEVPTSYMSKKDTSGFYSSLPVLESFFQISNPRHYTPLPDDWYVGVTDIVDSTKAVEEQKYKFVNILGASPIIGLLNITGKEELPFSFGGDGCVICFPAHLIEKAQKVLAASREIGRREYELELRTGIVPISVIRNAGYDVQIARFKATEYYNQAVFIGGGLMYAEDLLKSDGNARFEVPEYINTTGADFPGWNADGRK